MFQSYRMLGSICLCPQRTAAYGCLLSCITVFPLCAQSWSLPERPCWRACVRASYRRRGPSALAERRDGASGRHVGNRIMRHPASRASASTASLAMLRV